MVLQYDESVRNLLYRRSCQYTQGVRSGGHVEEAADLVEMIKSFAKRYPGSTARRDLFEDSLSEWSSESRVKGFGFMGLGFRLVSVEVEEDRDTLSWDGSLIALSLATKAECSTLDGRHALLLGRDPGSQARSGGPSFKLNPQHEEESSPSSEEQAQEPQGQQQEAGWLKLSDIDRITMEAASPSGPVDQQTSEEELLAGKPISLELDKSVGKLHDTFCSPGNVEFMTLGAWAATPTLGSKRNMLKEKLRAYLGEQRWTRVQGNKAARRGSAFSPRAAATDALEQEAESDDIESRSVSLLFLAISKFAEHHGLSCTGKVDKQDRLRLMMREEVDMEAEEGEGVEEEAGAGLSRA
ncbi:hypothetical protein GUITHDRAFT_117728 [Guillardia theta CCMP2712]|uniref:Uncharacterized protein n=1 Tax=Guillardia theta (strain CCMP2712) TaxID=905079 RepID=L1IIK3_GUITC|nr:hypothetical protein GUITHDRAFT_117728 [Guillardia theta CCMP2712]EKX36061.1 hypothetical protein GUITHDRAFT_117728 [Guillardia theta CCMP2712]|eukprot:XP_005823041.1 hypothetical protein GUITHDRAFT_117728 [Guillardia theta CCMP2712]